MSEGRRGAAVVLQAVRRGRRLDLAFEEVAHRLPLRERRWVQEATYGVQRFRGRLDFLLDLHLARGLSSLSPPILDLLRLGAYQLLYMGSVPPYAAISETVDQVGAIGGSGTGRMANGVLRSLHREGGGVERFPDFHSEPLAHLGSWGSHPTWLLERWVRRWDPEEVRRLVDWNNTIPPLYLHPLEITLEEALQRLSGEGVEARIPGGGIPCLQLPDGINPAGLLDGFPGIIQDPGAALVAEYAAPPPGVTAFDLCAAPGGKALAFAGKGTYVLAADRSFARMRILARNAERVGGRVTRVVADARRPPFLRIPYVLLDVPCSGTGTFRRHPDARWRLTPKMIGRLVEVQREILRGVVPLIPPGGHLVYSTCTLEEEENEGQMEVFRSRNPGFVVENLETVDPAYLDDRGFLRVLPQTAGFDGAFSARFVRES